MALLKVTTLFLVFLLGVSATREQTFLKRDDGDESPDAEPVQEQPEEQVLTEQDSSADFASDRASAASQEVAADEGPIDHSNGVVDSKIDHNNQDEVYDMTGHGFHILSRHENTQEAIAERNLAEVNKMSR